jgi:hypothetical protein
MSFRLRYATLYVLELDMQGLFLLALLFHFNLFYRNTRHTLLQQGLH